MAVVALCAAVLALGAGTSQEGAAPRCGGLEATIVGTGGPDVLRGTPGRDVIWGGPGDDLILGLDGHDVICGGSGDDVIFGGVGVDRIYGAPGDDEIHGALGSDILRGGPGADLIQGGRGNDLLDGGAGDGDRMIGGLGDDKALGGPGDFDEVAGGLGIDVVNGGPGDFDLVHGDYGYDRMDGGPGKGDIASFATSVAGGRGGGVWVSLRAHKARGDGHDRLFRFEDIEGSAFKDTLIGDKRANVIDGGPGDDTIIGGGGADTLVGGQGSDRCRGAKGRTVSCGKEAAPKASAYVTAMPARGGGGGFAIVGGGGRDDFTVAFDEGSSRLGVTAAAGIAIGPGCERLSPVQVSCHANPARWLMADLGPGNDRLRVEGSLAGVQNVRLAGGLGDDTIRGGPEDDLIEAGPGSDRLYGGAGSDGLIGGLPGPTFLYGGPGGDLLAAGGGCAGGVLVGGSGRDNGSFAETQAHPGLLIISLPRGKAWIDVVRGCRPVRLDRSIEDIEGSFDDDVLVGDRRANNLLGQPGRDRFYGGAGDDVIDARDGVRDFVIQCGRRGRPDGRVLADSFDPPAKACAVRKHGTPVLGLNNSG